MTHRFGNVVRTTKGFFKSVDLTVRKGEWKPYIVWTKDINEARVYMDIEKAVERQKDISKHLKPEVVPVNVETTVKVSLV